jgi:hypothetical protein
MQKALFNTSKPFAAEGDVEFYNISIRLEDIEGQRLSVVQEAHGWWNNETGQAVFDVDFASPPETFVSFDEAVDRYCTLRANRARTGFIHSFSWHPITGFRADYRPIDSLLESQFESQDGSSS